MAFIRKRISPSKRKTPSYQVIETYREDGKVKQRVLANLGCNPTPEKALSEFRRELEVTLGVIEQLKMKGASCTEASGDRVVDRHFEKWWRTYVRQQETVDRLEALVSSGKKWSSPEICSKDHSSEASTFLDWVLERNSRGWV